MAVAALLLSVPLSAGELPDHHLTPGAVRGLTPEQVCSTKWGRDERHVTEAMKRRVFEEYGYPRGNKDPRCPCEIDHLASRELGGSDDVKNLWVQPYQGPWNAHLKDRLENKLHVEVCAGRLSLSTAQRKIIKDWTKLYRQYFGDPQ